VGLLFVFVVMMGRDLGDVAWRPPSRTDRSSSDRSSSDRSASSRASSSRSAASTNGQASRPDRTSNRRSDRAGRPRESRDAPAESSSGDETAPEAESSNGAEPKQSSMLTRLLFHTSLPINEALDLRAGDVDFDAGMIYVSDAMGTPKRIVEIPDTLVDPLHEHVRDVRDDYPGQPLDAPLFQANALKGRTAEASDAGAPDADASDAGEASEAESTPSPDPVEADDDSRPSLWHYAGN
jgi:integrase